MSTSARWFVGPLHASLYLTLSLVWMLTLGIALAATAALVAGDALATGDPTLLGAGWVGTLTSVQTAGLGALAVALALFLPEPPSIISLPSRPWRNLWWDRLALTPAPGAWMVASLSVGATIGLVAGDVAERAAPWLPQDGLDSLGMLTALFQAAPPGELLLLLLAVCVVAPVAEEVIFRGYMWSALGLSMPQPVVWIVTTLLFTAYHVSPVQAVALIPTSLMLGLLRWRSGSILPPITAHFVNNAIAAAASVYPAWSDIHVPLRYVLAAGSLSILAVCIAELRWRPRRP